MSGNSPRSGFPGLLTMNRLRPTASLALARAAQGLHRSEFGWASSALGADPLDIIHHSTVHGLARRKLLFIDACGTRAWPVRGAQP